MGLARSTAGWYYARFAVSALLAAGAIGGVGYWPTVRLAGGDAAWAMAAACGISWFASCVGAIPLVPVWAGRATRPINAVLASTGLRFLAVLALVVPLVFSGWFDRTVLVVWVAVSYLFMLLIDTIFAARLMSRACRKTDEGKL